MQHDFSRLAWPAAILGPLLLFVILLTEMPSRIQWITFLWLFGFGVLCFCTVRVIGWVMTSFRD